MRYLIDGYNLLYAMGLLQGKAGPHGLEKARLALLGRLFGSYGPDAGRVTVVFDAAHAPPGADPDQDYQGIHVHFAVRREADDLIEDLIRHESAPRQLTVVSDDHRVRQSARRRHCPVLGCLAYLEEVEQWRRRRAAPPDEVPAKPEGVSRPEVERWLQEFADLDKDPKVRAVLGSPFPDDEVPGDGLPPRPADP
jgi:predicted RNA-binding protein with PIN domain